MKYFYMIHEINFITCRLMAMQSAVFMSMCTCEFLKLMMVYVPVLNGQLLSLVPSAAIQGMNQEVCTLGF